MGFWAYMLHCRGGYFYVGHTDELERRVGEHQSGLIPGFAADHRPVELVWSQDFATRDEAKAAEEQIKGWSRSKKLALIRGDWDRISSLTKGKNGPSTSSGKTEKGKNSKSRPDHAELVEALSFSLDFHPQHPPSLVSHVTAKIVRSSDHWLQARWRIEGSGAILFPPFAGRGRAGGLWQTTCFELFLKAGESPNYTELNLSPSERWAAYDFSGYREGMAERPMPRDPVCTLRTGQGMAFFDAAIPLAGLPDLPWVVGISAVIEEEGGRRSYWALAHPPGKPDFHHPACFAAVVPAPSAP